MKITIIKTIGLIIFLLIVNLGISQQLLYGVTQGNGSSNSQTIFSYDPLSNNWTTEFTFPYSTGQIRMPVAGMTMAPNGKFYGVCYKTYTNSYSGGIYEYDPVTGVYAEKVQFFFWTTGGNSEAGLLLASNGKLYGTTNAGGGSSAGEIFEFDPATGTITQNRSFYTYVGHTPVGGLIQGTNGKLYGVTTQSGEFGEGSIYEYDITANSLTRLYGFPTSGGWRAWGKLLQASNGLLYGTTQFGPGQFAYDGVLYSFNLSTNTYTELVQFDGISKGSRGTGSLIQASNGSIYGTTQFGGTSSKGVLFEYNITSSTFTKHYNFDGITGKWPEGELFEFTNGKLYGLTSSGGTYDGGVMFEFDLSTDSFAVTPNGNLGWPFIGRNPKKPELTMYCKSPEANQTINSYSFCEGENVNVHLNSTNTDTYVWKKSGVPIGQTSDSLNFASLLLSDAGTYTCEMTNVCGMVTSAVFTITANASYSSTETQLICSGSSYVFPDGTSQSNITSQVVYTSNLQTVNSCDSVIITTVNVNPTYNLTETQSVCSGDSYTFPNGTTQNNIISQVVYTSNLQTVNLCDSIIITTVNVNPTYNLTETQLICSGDSYAFPDGTTQSNITSQVVYTSNLQTVNSCDSIIITTVNVNPTYNLTEIQSICSGDSYTFPNGTTQSNIISQVIYTSNLQTVSSCDSVIITTVNVNPSYNLTEIKSVCSGMSYTFPDGTTQNNITSQVVYTSNMQTVNLCDSIIVTTVNVNTTIVTSTDTRTECNPFVWIDGNTYFADDSTATFNIVGGAANGCDSLVTLNLTITVVNTSVTKTGTDLTANELVATYQWLDCNNNYAIIPNETFRTYYTTTPGSYAVAVTYYGCTDTSACYNVVGINEQTISSNFNIYPNPVKDQLIIESKGLKIEGIEIIDVTGKVVKIIYENISIINVTDLLKGLYILQILTQEGVEIKHFIKE